MRKPVSKILILLMALVLMVSLLPATALATETTSPLAGWSLTLCDRISANFHFTIADSDRANSVVNFTMENQKLTVNASDVTKRDANGNYVFTVGLAAAQMTDKFGVELVTGGTRAFYGEYSVRQYADTILGDTKGTYSDNDKAIVVAMLNYGAAAQTYFNHNTGNLAITGYEDQVVTYNLPSNPDGMETGSMTGVSLHGRSLLFKSRTTVRFYFNVEGDINSYTFTDGKGKTYTPGKMGAYYVVDVTDINPQELADIVKMTVSKGEESMTVSYSPLHYMIRKNKDSNPTLKGLVQSMYDYHMAAVSYMKYVNSVEAGHMGSHTSDPRVTEDGCTGFYFTLAANDAAYGDWNVEYKPASADCIKLIRNGAEPVAVANAGAGTLVKLNETDYFLKMEAWMNGNFPLQVGDILVVEGAFTYYGTFDTIHISKTYAEYTASGFLFYTVLGGALQTHTNGGNYKATYGTLTANDLPYNSDWSVEYKPLTADTIKLVRDGVTTSVGNTQRGTLVKFSDTDYYLKYEAGMHDSLPLQPFDYLIVDGVFANATNGQSIRINTTYVYYNGATVVLQDTEPTVPTNIYEIGVLGSHAEGKNGTSGFYATAAASDAPYDGWVRYKPLRADCVQFYDASEDKTTSVANTSGEMLVKFSETEYYFEGWTMGGTFETMAKGDYYIIEGEFYNAANDAYIVIDKTYVAFDGEKLTFSATGPVFIFDAGLLSNHESGADSDGVYATMAENDAPYDGWNIEYTPVAAENYRVIRDGVEQNIGIPGRGTLVKFSSTEYYLKHSGWCLNDFTATTDDVFIIEGHWKSTTDESIILNISKTYLYHDGTQWVFSEYAPMTVYNLNVLGTNSTANDGSGKEETEQNETLLYFSVDRNGAPAGEYYPAKAANLKFVRDGVTHDVGTNAGTIALGEGSDHWLKLATWTVSGELLPLKETDYLIVEGRYIAHTADMGECAIEISRSYVYHDGYKWVWSDSEPIDAIVTGPLSIHANGANVNDNGIMTGIYLSMASNAAPYSDWLAEYAPVTADGLKLIRNGETIPVGFNNRGTLVKIGDTTYYLKFEWNIGDYQNTVTTSDVIVVEGYYEGLTHYDGAGNPDYTDAAGVVMNIPKSYIYYDGSSWVVSQTLPTIVNGGVMSAHDDGFDGEMGGYFTLAANSLPVDEDAETEYTANAGVIKLVRAGEICDLSGTVVKIGETDYYMTLAGDKLPMQDHDYLVVEGAFVNEDNGYTLKIAKSYIFVDGEEFIFSTTEPDVAYQVGVLSAHDGGGSATGFNATGLENNAPYSEWAAEYAPTSKECIQIIRNGETIYRTNTGAGAIIKLGGTGYYVKFDTWIDSTNYPLQAGDMIIIEGDFVGTSNYAEAQGVKIHIDKTYVVYDGTSFTFSDSEPKTIYQVGVLSAHDGGGSATGFNATGLENDAPYNADNIWQAEYAPTSKECIQVVRNGETIYRTNTGAGAIIKMGGSRYYVKFDAWIDSTNYPLQAGDMIIIEGDFVGTANYAGAEGAMIHIDKTYVVYDGTSFTFSDTEPVSGYPVTNLTNHSNGWTTGGIYISHDAHGATYNSDWSVEYAPISADAIKLVRGGETYSVGTSSGTLVVYSQTAMFLKTEAWTISGNKLPLVGGDTLILEGQFQHSASGDIINIEKTEIVVNENGTLSFIGEGDKYIDGGVAYAHSEGWDVEEQKEVVFFMNKNGLPVDSTSATRYNPTSTATIKKIRNGVTTNVGNTGAETIYKNYDERYAIAAWAVGGVQAGDVLIIEGDFVNASNGYTLHIDKSYLTLNADGTVTASRAEDTDFGGIQLPIVPATMTIGMWNGSHHTFDDATMDKLVAAGITRIIGIRPQYAGDVNALLDRAQAKGISIILDIRNETTTISFRTGYFSSSTVSKDSEYWNGDDMIGTFDLSTLDLHHPALEGLSVFDEPWVYSTDTAKIQAAKTAFDALDKKDDLLFFVNLLPECSGEEKFWEQGYSWNYDPGTDYEANYVDTLLGLYGGDAATAPLSWDNYTLIRDASNKLGIRTDFYHNFEVMQNKSNPAWFTMLSAGHNAGVDGCTYTTPTQDELRWQMAVAMAYGVQNINHYVFTTTATDYTCMVTIDSNGDITRWNALYDDVARVGQEYKSWEDIFMAYDYIGTGVYDSALNGTNNSMFAALEKELTLSNYGITVTSDQDMLVGVFENNGNKAYMVTNAGTPGGTTVADGEDFYMNGHDGMTLNVGTGFRCVAVIDEGEISYLSVDASGNVVIPIEAYEGVFVIPVA